MGTGERRSSHHHFHILWTNPVWVGWVFRARPPFTGFWPSFWVSLLYVIIMWAQLHPLAFLEPVMLRSDAAVFPRPSWSLRLLPTFSQFLTSYLPGHVGCSSDLFGAHQPEFDRNQPITFLRNHHNQICLAATEKNLSILTEREQMRLGLWQFSSKKLLTLVFVGKDFSIDLDGLVGYLIPVVCLPYLFAYLLLLFIWQFLSQEYLYFRFQIFYISASKVAPRWQSDFLISRNIIH